MVYVSELQDLDDREIRYYPELDLSRAFVEVVHGLHICLTSLVHINAIFVEYFSWRCRAMFHRGDYGI